MIEFKNLTGKKINTPVLAKLHKKTFGQKSKAFNLSVAFAAPNLMRRLNKQFRTKDKPTDVLAFPLGRQAGEIVINAREKNIPHLFVHGCLHLLGYDHKNTREYKAMQNKEIEILSKRKK